MNIVLTGMRGAGKSSLSRRLSVLTKWPVVSTDLLIQYEAKGKSIAQIVADNGWHNFRELEYQVVQKVAQLNNVIIDCGGGIVVDLDTEGNEQYSSRKIDLLKQNGQIIWLKGDIARLAAKVKNDQERPTLDQLKSAEELMERRLPFYKEAADDVVNIEGKKKRQLSKEIFRLTFKPGPA
ncbi:MAG: shikimate kinase [Chromatiales bacterium]|nr:shikimate kinase [Chromatiales bacterium]